MKHRPEELGLRTVAVIEATKGVFVLALGLGLFSLIHKDLDDIADRLTDMLHVNPDGRLSNLFFKAADKLTDKALLVIAIGAMVYSAVRFVEAYGLWHEREWAEWFALLSGCLYLPWEMLSIVRHPHPFKWIVLAINLVVVLYMFVRRLKAAGIHVART
ncbi:MAG: DUF2127 domain-containing protein [Acidobacteria bacterium]|nr:DUF2127 domain-containing protein [Acidobacteriota bacterium]